MTATLFTVTEHSADQRLDTFLTENVDLAVSRSYIQKLIIDGKIAVNQLPQKSRYKVQPGDKISIDIPKTEDFSKQSLPVIFEDANVVVINKPAGILTHSKGAPLDEFTVAEFMRVRTTDQPDGNRPGIVHRLDRDTSGVIIGAKNPETHAFLQRQFSEKKVKKTYIALLSAIPKEPEAIVRLPIERNPNKPQTFTVGINGKPAETTYKVIQTLSDNTALVELKPLTGRTHQLRVHMAYIGCPILGDKLYGTALEHLRLCLHAASLEITLPGGERRTFEALLPDDIKAVITKLHHHET